MILKYSAIKLLLYIVLWPPPDIHNTLPVFLIQAFVTLMVAPASPFPPGPDDDPGDHFDRRQLFSRHTRFSPDDFSPQPALAVERPLYQTFAAILNEFKHSDSNLHTLRAPAAWDDSFYQADAGGLSATSVALSRTSSIDDILGSLDVTVSFDKLTDPGSAAGPFAGLELIGDMLECACEIRDHQPDSILNGDLVFSSTPASRGFQVEELYKWNGPQIILACNPVGPIEVLKTAALFRDQINSILESTRELVLEYINERDMGILDEEARLSYQQTTVALNHRLNDLVAADACDTITPGSIFLAKVGGADGLIYGTDRSGAGSSIARINSFRCEP